MIIDKELPTVKASETDKHIMNLCDETQWIRFIDKCSNQRTISDFRSADELKGFLPSITISQFIKICENGQLTKLRIHRMNLLRHSIPSYKKQWDKLGNDYVMKDKPHKGYYSVDFSDKFLKSNGKMKLIAVKYTA